jgi:hypothetical protein
VSQFELDLYDRCLPGVQAWQILNDPDQKIRYNAAQVYDLFLQAGYPEETAQKAATEHANARLDRNLPA